MLLDVSGLCALVLRIKKKAIKHIHYLVQEFAIWATPVSSYLLKQMDRMSVIMGWIIFFQLLLQLFCLCRHFSPGLLSIQICQLAIMTAVKNS